MSQIPLQASIERAPNQAQASSIPTVRTAFPYFWFDATCALRGAAESPDTLMEEKREEQNGASASVHL